MMKQVKLLVPEYLFNFYRKIGQQVGRSPEMVMADTLFKTAGELSEKALSKGNSPRFPQ